MLFFNHDLAVADIGTEKPFLKPNLHFETEPGGSSGAADPVLEFEVSFDTPISGRGHSTTLAIGGR